MVCLASFQFTSLFKAMILYLESKYDKKHSQLDIAKKLIFLTYFSFFLIKKLQQFSGKKSLF